MISIYIYINKADRYNIVYAYTTSEYWLNYPASGINQSEQTVEPGS